MTVQVVPGSVGVVIVTYQGRAWIERCLESLFARGDPPYVIVVDNASEDGTTAWIRQHHPQVQLLAQSHNLGFGRGNNVGIRAALDRGCEYVFLLNQDAFVVDDAIDRLRAFLATHPGFGACSPLHCSPDESHVDARTFRGYLQCHAEAYLFDACFGRVRPSYKVYGVNAAAWFVRASTFERSGGFDPLFFMYGEDDDLLARWAHLGIDFALLTDCRIVHLRQSPPRPSPSVLQDVLRRSDRRRSELMGAIKRPGFSLRHMMLVWLALGCLEPATLWLQRRSTRDLLGSWHAAMRVLGQLPSIRRHVQLTSRPGAHFL